MTLRLRLTLLYSSLLGGILLLFGVVTYAVVSFQLTNQVDEMLSEATVDLLKSTRVDSYGQIIVLQLPRLDMATNVYVQAWEREGKLADASPGISHLTEPLDPLGLSAESPVFRDARVQGAHIRVLSVPVEVGDRSVGILQIATSLMVVDSARRDLLYILSVVTVFSVALAFIGSWFVVGRALAPLETVTSVALQINRADDLSRRIPYHGPSNDEIGGLIESFNQTLERLEMLFTSQQRFLADVSHELPPR